MFTILRQHTCATRKCNPMKFVTLLWTLVWNANELGRVILLKRAVYLQSFNKAGLFSYFIWGSFGSACQFPRSGSSGMRGKTELLLEAEWLLEALSKQSFGFVNSGAYLAITASRCFMRQTTCYGNAFSLSLILSLFLLRRRFLLSQTQSWPLREDIHLYLSSFSQAHTCPLDKTAGRCASFTAGPAYRCRKKLMGEKKNLFWRRIYKGKWWSVSVKRT